MASEIAALGLDVGSATTKLVGVDNAGAMVITALEETDPHIEAQSRRLLDESGAASGVPLVTTGYGRKLAAGEGRAVTEITCHARGVHESLGRAGTLVDIGGQDSKVIVLDGRGKVVDFAMNDKCAAGTGRFLENTAARLKLPIAEMAEVALGVDKEVSISSTCTVFAESELVSLIARGAEMSHIVRGLHRALIRRVVALARSAHGGVARRHDVPQARRPVVHQGGGATAKGGQGRAVEQQP